jgi:predicted RNase H-like nuclease (RuvC/YqgF family)
MNEIIKNKVEIFKTICLYELNDAKISSDTISMNNGSQRCFEIIIKNNNDDIIALVNFVEDKNIETNIESIEDKIEKGLLNYPVYIYSIGNDKIMYITPYREWPISSYENMGMTPKDFIKRLKNSHEELKQDDDLEFDRLNVEINNLKQHNSENEKKYEKLKSDSELYKKIYNREIEKLEKNVESNKRNELDRLKYEFDKIKDYVDLLTPLRKMKLAEKCEYSFSFQKDEIIAKVDRFWYFEGGKDEVARWSDSSGCNYFRMDLDNMEYEEITDNRYSDIINWLRFDM